MLAFLDEFENHPNFYVREYTKVKLPNGDIIECWVYFLQNYPDSFLKLQHFDNYDSYGDHGLLYITRYHRDQEDILKFRSWNKLNHNFNS